MLRLMNIHKAPLSTIDFDDEAFRITEDLELDRVCASLQAVGLIQPVVLLEGLEASEYTIVCGFRRLHGLRRLGMSEAAATVLPAGLNMRDIFLKALWDNLAHRQLNALENARVLFTLKHACGVSTDDLVRQFLPMLGLPAHSNVLLAYLSLHELHPDLRRLLKAGHMTLATAERLGRLDTAAQAAAAGTFAKVRLSASLQREVLDILEDLAAMTHSEIAGILSAPEIAGIAGDLSLSPFQKGEQLHALLYARRYPRVTGAREKFQAAKAELNLPGTIRVSPDPFFEAPRLRVEFEAGSARTFRQAVESLQTACRSSALERLFDIS